MRVFNIIFALIMLCGCCGNATIESFTKEQLALPGKKGVCFTLRDIGQRGAYDKNMPIIESLNVYWNYSWGCNIVPNQPDNVEFVPMLWGGHNLDEKFISTLKESVDNGRFKRLLAFNEPDKNNQSNMSVQRALDLWPLLESLSIPLGSPAPVNALGRAGSSDPDVDPEDLRWLEIFMERAEELNYRVDYICVHNYGGASSENFLNLLQEIHEKYNRPLLITEFAVADWQAASVEDNRHSKERVLQFMKEVLPAMEELDYVIGYSWFSFDIDSPQGATSALIDNDGNLTELGEYYSNFKPNK